MRLYGLLGKTLKHSFSKAYFTDKFTTLQINDCRYENFELAFINELPQLLKENPFIKGLNVTIPYKEDVIQYLHESSDIVKEINACNCINIINEKLIGYNTDVFGFQQSLVKYLLPHHKNALILGTGGAAKAVQFALRNLNIAYQNVSRVKNNSSVIYEELDKATLDKYQLIINTSPLGMFPKINEAPPIPYDYINQDHLLFDLIYNPDKTEFLKRGEEKGARTANGSEMLILQAEESWRIWNS